MERIEGQILPRIWTQGNTRCIIRLYADEIADMDVDICQYDKRYT